jgi:hypothetical protein
MSAGQPQPHDAIRPSGATALQAQPAASPSSRMRWRRWIAWSRAGRTGRTPDRRPAVHRTAGQRAGDAGAAAARASRWFRSEARDAGAAPTAASAPSRCKCRRRRSGIRQPPALTVDAPHASAPSRAKPVREGDQPLTGSAGRQGAAAPQAPPAVRAQAGPQRDGSRNCNSTRLIACRSAARGGHAGHPGLPAPASQLAAAFESGRDAALVRRRRLQ